MSATRHPYYARIRFCISGDGCLPRNLVQKNEIYDRSHLGLGNQGGAENSVTISNFTGCSLDQICFYPESSNQTSFLSELGKEAFSCSPLG